MKLADLLHKGERSNPNLYVRADLENIFVRSANTWGSGRTRQKSKFAGDCLADGGKEEENEWRDGGWRWRKSGGC